MNVNKKFDRLMQWSKERMGGETKTDTSDEFKAMEVEMQLRQDGMEKLKKASDVYIQYLGRRDRHQDKEQQLPVAYFGTTMVAHGDDFDPDSEFGQCLSTMGRANERIARMQETYCVNATSSWLESLERSLVQLKEYQKARRQLDSRRLAYDTASTKMHKSKKEDFRMEEELRAQKMKYEESSEDVYRRMLDIKEAEAESVQDLSSLLEAELTYYDRCRELLMQVKKDWPAPTHLGRGSRSTSPINGNATRRGPRSRTGSINRTVEEEPVEPPPRIGARVPTGTIGSRKESPSHDLPARMTVDHRSLSANGFEGPRSLNRAESPAELPHLNRIPTESASILGARANLRNTKSREPASAIDVFGDDHGEYANRPLAHSGESNRAPSWPAGAHDGRGGNSAKKTPPPPPPSRAKKPPPPPPMKRSTLSANDVLQHHGS